MSKENLRSLILRLKIFFKTKGKTLKCFSKYGVQVEGWFKGELLHFLHREKKVGKIVDFDRVDNSNLNRQF